MVAVAISYRNISTIIIYGLQTTDTQRNCREQTHPQQPTSLSHMPYDSSIFVVLSYKITHTY